MRQSSIQVYFCIYIYFAMLVVSALEQLLEGRRRKEYSSTWILPSRAK